MTYHNFPIPPKEFNTVVKAISPGLIHLVKSHTLYNPRRTITIQSTLFLNGIDFLDKKFTNRHVRQIFQFKKKILWRGKFHWRSFVEDIDWKRLLPGKYCIVLVSNQKKHLQICFMIALYPSNFGLILAHILYIFLNLPMLLILSV